MSNEKYRYRLRSCVWEITLMCCFSCKYCGSKAGKERANELTTEECLNISKQLADMGCQRVSLIGGEVFMRSDWALIAKSLVDLNINVSIITNGFHLTDELISEIKACKVESVAVSLDGPKWIHDEYRQKGSFQRAVNVIDVLSHNDIPVSVITTLHSQNIHSLESLYNVLKDKKIYAWQLQACSPMGNATEGLFSTTFNFSSVIAFVEKYMFISPFMIGIADNIGYYTEKENYLRGSLTGKARFLGCKAGLSTIGIDSIGNVRGCESMYDDAFIEANLREKSLHDIWTDPKAFSYNRMFTMESLSGKCATCDNASICAGGCRSYNYFTHGKMYESIGCVHGKKSIIK